MMPPYGAMMPGPGMADPGMLMAPPNAMVAAPPPQKSGKGLLIVAAIVALLIAAGVTFVILRSRAG
jgi:hypothetical protein